MQQASNFSLNVVALLATVGSLGGCSAEPSETSRPEESVAVSTEALKAGDDYVAVPHARVHKSCIFEVPEGAIVDEDLNVVVNGKKIAGHDRCKHQAKKRSTDPNPTACPSGGSQASCWVEDNNFFGTPNAWGISWFNALGADWEVPQVPITFANQLIYMFPGLQDLPVTYIMQPVLQWGVGAAGGGNFWAMANWFVSTDGSAMHTPLVAVSPGTWIHGEMDALWDSCDSSGVCRWGINYAINGDWHGMTVNPTHPATWAFKGALEAYDSTRTSFPGSCDLYPSSGTTNFVNFFASQPGPGTNEWNTGNWAGSGFIASGLPDCGFGVSDFAGSNTYDGAAYFGY